MEDTFGPDDINQLIQHLHKFMEERKLDDELDDPAIQTRRDEIHGVLKALMKEFIDEFPRSGSWSREIALTSKSSLEVLALSLDSFSWFHTEDEPVERDWVARMFRFVGTMGHWIKRSPPDVEVGDGPTPLALRDHALDTICHILGHLRRDLNSRKEHKHQPWTVARQLYSELSASIIIVVTAASSTPFIPFQLCLFQTPRTTFHVEPVGDDPSTTFNIAGPHEANSTILDLIQPLVSCATPMPAASDHLLSDTLRQAAETLCFVFRYFTTDAVFRTEVQKSDAMSRLITASSDLLVDQDCALSIGPYFVRLLLRRLKEGPKPNWRGVDESLAQAISKSDMAANVTAHVSYVVEAIKAENWDEEANELHDACSLYILRCIPSLSLEAAKNFRSLLETTAMLDTYQRVLGDLDRRIAYLSTPLPTDATAAHKRKRDRDLDANERIAEICQRLMPDNAEVIEPSSEGVWLSEALDNVENAVLSSWPELELPERESVLKDLRLLFCAIRHPGASDCALMESHRRDLHGVVQLYVRLALTFLEDAGEDISPATWKGSCQLLVHALSHGDYVNSLLRDLLGIIKRGSSSPERAVRLETGKLAASLIQAMQRSSVYSLTECEEVIRPLSEILARNNIRFQETTITSLGYIGRVSNTTSLSAVVMALIAQFNQKTSFIQALAYSELLSLCKFYNKGPTAFLSPYFRQISCFVALRICTAPSYINDTCRLLGRSITDFLNITQSHILPVLVATCSKAALTELAANLGRDVGSLIVQWASNVLAHLLMLPRPEEMQNGFQFIAEVFAGYRKELGVENLLLSHRIEIMTELVIAMADEKADTAKRATEAIRRLERRYARMNPRAKGAPLSLSEFLQPVTLGILSQLNTAITASRAKASMSHKKQILRSLGVLIATIGPSISNISPQIMAMLHSMISVEALTETTLETWRIFAITLSFREFGPHAGPTSAVIVDGWPAFNAASRRLAKQIIDYILLDNSDDIGPYVQDIVTLETIPELNKANQRLQTLREPWSLGQQIRNLLDRCTNDNVAVSARSLGELKTFMTRRKEDFRKFSSGDVFDPVVSEIVKALFKSACRDGDGCEGVRMEAYSCIGALGALDPDRFEIAAENTTKLVIHNFTDEGENVSFAIHLISDLLVGSYRAASDITYQNNLAYAIQELLRFCDFTPALVMSNTSTTVPNKIRQRWGALPPSVVETVGAFLEGRLTLKGSRATDISVPPIYTTVATYREWIQKWTQYLITRVTGAHAKRIFDVFQAVLKHQDAVVAHHILPHLVLNLIISGEDSDRGDIQNEIVTVLRDSIEPRVGPSSDKRLLSAQTVFSLMDYASKWIRHARQLMNAKRARGGRPGINTNNALAEQLMFVESLLGSIDHDLMAKAAFECKAYARALMNFEHQIMAKRKRSSSEEDMQPYYERLHEIYAQLDEPDGMEGISSKVLFPSLEHQIREHESLGRWTSAQSCWEIKLQHSPEDIELHIGLLRCLRNLGHYDTLRTHIRGVLSRNPDWTDPLAGFQAEGSYMVGDWDDVQTLIRNTRSEAPEINIARLLLALRSNDAEVVRKSILASTQHLGGPITAAGQHSYRRSYEAVINLHIVRELEFIHETALRMHNTPKHKERTPQRYFNTLTNQLAGRLVSTLPSFRAREPILSMRRIALGVALPRVDIARREIGRAWLATAKIARKAGHSQTAYSAMLQAKQFDAPFAVIQSSKLLVAEGETHRALQELDAFLVRAPVAEEDDEVQHTRMMAKALLCRARWMDEAERFHSKELVQAFRQSSSTAPDWESGFFYTGRFNDKQRSAVGVSAELASSYAYQICKAYTLALAQGSKYIFQTLPRLLTLWLDLGEDESVLLYEKSGKDTHLSDEMKTRWNSFRKVNMVVEKALGSLLSYQWFSAFPQIVSRIEHPSRLTFDLLAKLIVNVLIAHPQQALWLFTTVVKSRRKERYNRGVEIMDKVKATLTQRNGAQAAELINKWAALTTELLKLCDYPVENESMLSLTKFPGIAALMPCPLIIPLQNAMTVLLPSSSAEKTTHQPFPPNLPTIHAFHDEIEIMKSLAKPRKITLVSSHQTIHNFLCKPKDDLRKDARLMDFNGIINKLLKTNSESRRRKLHIRTYSVVPLNEECGFIEWVPNTIALRHIIHRLLEPRGISLYPKPLTEEYERAREAGEATARKVFLERILLQSPAVFNEWFIATFPEPTSWLASRLAYGRTVAVMSMVGYILGLGDRHGENILLDSTTGDVVHVDFNCLFEKGKTFNIPERVPFRLSQNIVDGLGVSGVEGVYRNACEVTMQILRDNKDSLMSVLEAFVHDPLVEWEDERRNQERALRKGVSRKRPETQSGEVVAAQIRAMAQKALRPIQRKLMGLPSTDSERSAREVKTKNQVENLINEATDPTNLAMMYYGWASWL